MPVVRLEGLPFRVSKEELSEFFSESKVESLDKIHLIMNREGRASGLGYVELTSEEAVEKAVAKSEQNIARHNRYAKVVECDQEELDWYTKRGEAHTKKQYRVKMQGLPFRASEYQIAKWFEPDCRACDVEIHLNREGRPSGEATAFFDTLEHSESAMSKDKEEMGGRYINLSKQGGNKPLARQGYFVRMAGLPFRTSDEEIVDFFAKVDAKCVGVRIIFNRDGRPSGDAVAEFESDQEAEKAMKQNREHIGSRFVILTREDAGSGGDRSSSYQDRYQSGNGSGSGKFTIRMGGLPFRAAPAEIREWFEPEAKCSHVKLLMNRDGRPSGEALAEFETEDEAEQAMTKNKQYMGERFVILTAQY